MLLFARPFFSPNPSSYHDNRLVTEFLEVVIDSSDALNTRILLVGVILCGVLRFIVVEDTANERRDEIHTCLGASNCLSEREDEGHITIDFLLLECLSSFDAFPGGRDFDENSFLADSCIFIHLNDSFGLFGKRC